jgi:hypothetical protein
MSTTSKTTTQAHDAQVIVGIKKDLQNVSSLPLAGSAITPAALVLLLQSRIDMVNTVANAKANWHDTVAKYKALNAQVTLVVRGLRQYVLNVFGASSPVLADFGFTAPKKTPLTPEQKVVKAQKAAATRKARGTKGKVQKKAVKGSVEVTVSATPTVTVPAPAVTPPAPPAPTGGNATPAGGATPAAGSGAAHS